MTIAEYRKINFPICQANKSFNKVFGIGANKTGTTSLQAIFFAIGLKVSPQHEGEIYGVQAMRGNIFPIKDYIEKYDAFQDAPFSLKTVFAQVDALFQNSKFILTIRDPEEWFESIKNSHSKIMEAKKTPEKIDIEKYKYLFDEYLKEIYEHNFILDVDKNISISVNWDKSYQKDFFIRNYNLRNEIVARHFSQRRKDLLVIDITKEKNTGKIIDFLNLPSRLVMAMPHANKTLEL